MQRVSAARPLRAAGSFPPTIFHAQTRTAATAKITKMNTTQMTEMTFQLNPEGRPTDAPALFAYLVNSDGDTIETQPIGEKGLFKFKTKAEALHGSRLLVAPEMPDKSPRPTLEELRDFNAYEPALRLDPKSKLQAIAAIPAALRARP